MTEKRYIINNNGEIENTNNHMTWDSFTEVLTVLNGQSRHLEELAEENDGLKTRLDYHQRMHEQYKRDSLAVVKDNEQLKSENDKLQKIEDDLNDFMESRGFKGDD